MSRSALPFPTVRLTLRRPVPLIDTTPAHPLTVELFAGGGGASAGICAALGRTPDIAIELNPDNAAAHALNAHGTQLLVGSVWDYRPADLVAGRPVELLWASPPCTEFSTVKAQRVLSRHVAGLSWVVVWWARTVRPRVIVTENVPEMRNWGPVRGGVMTRDGSQFQAWFAALESEGYEVTHQVVCSAELGAPTKRRRLLVIAKLSGEQLGLRSIGRLQCAAEHIAWSTPMKPYQRHNLNTRLRVERGEVSAAPAPDGNGTAWIIDYHGPKAEQQRGVTINAPLPTLLTKDRFLLCRRDHTGALLTRTLTALEFAALQGFGPDHVLPASSVTAKRVVGNSVVPAVARAAVTAGCPPEEQLSEAAMLLPGHRLPPLPLGRMRSTPT